MRWLFILVLILLVACVLSLVWMNDKSRWPLGDSRSQSVQQPSDAPFLPAPAPQQPGQ
jgi:cell division protein FtsL